ncbi:hypothetical protein VPNG_01758 [Cytospora leucostoma]|uniref:Carrier domain-containing protein n=1 Tax=Cytospora leucostoma TaxID=1230097 RepID=A0A423XLF7_9PEZI|nr:hypothetical protein VPNG_01758 [Cytospora leucostoma]
MSFTAWNIEHDASDEHAGLHMGGYDIIFAGSVLHATSGLSKSLRHIRNMLRPGGLRLLECRIRDTSGVVALYDASAYQGVSVSLDLGWLLDAGIVSEREDYRQKWQGAQDIAGVRAADLMAVLDHFCDPARRSTPTPGSGPSTTSLRSSPSQLLVGAVTPADLTQHGEIIAASMSCPLLDGFRIIPGMHNLGGGSTASDLQTQSPGARFRAAVSVDEKCNAVMDALRDKLAKALGVEMDDVDSSRAVSSYGVDSLMAVELRNWMRKHYNVDIAVFEILGGTTVVGLSYLVTSKAEKSE